MAIEIQNGRAVLVSDHSGEPITVPEPLSGQVEPIIAYDAASSASGNAEPFVVADMDEAASLATAREFGELATLPVSHYAALVGRAAGLRDKWMRERAADLALASEQEV